MSMANASRIKYLQAMGIDVWVPRHQPIGSENSVEDAGSAAELTIIQQSDKPVADWDQLQQQVEGCKLCALAQTRRQIVFGEGDKQADWMLIGEAPGHTEDSNGRPFSGQSGYLLTEMLRAIGLQRESVYIANVLKCSPPDNREPKVEELRSCQHFLQQQIQLVAPKIILAVGRVAAQSLLASKQPLSQLRGERHSVYGIPLVVVYHPAYLLRSLPEKRKAWEDLQLAMKIYQEQK